MVRDSKNICFCALIASPSSENKDEKLKIELNANHRQFTCKFVFVDL